MCGHHAPRCCRRGLLLREYLGLARVRQAISPCYTTLTLTFGLTLESTTLILTLIQIQIQTPTRPRTALPSVLPHARHDTLTIPGRLVALLDRSGHVIDPPHADLSVRRCASGTPLRSAGMVDAPRPLVGGCAREGDASYDPSAEVHVPQACSTYLAMCLSTCLHCSTSLPPLFYRSYHHPPASSGVRGAPRSGACRLHDACRAQL